MGPALATKGSDALCVALDVVTEEFSLDRRPW
jgi:hypothetical protein